MGAEKEGGELISTKFTQKFGVLLILKIEDVNSGNLPPFFAGRICGVAVVFVPDAISFFFRFANG